MEEESWPAGASAEMVSYAQEIAVSTDQVSHWVSFFAEHPQGKLAWEEISRLGKAPRRRPPKTPPPPPSRRK